jgi:urease accessory protein UreE
MSLRDDTSSTDANLKSRTKHVENIHLQDRKADATIVAHALHGDRALAIVGNQRIVLTDEDVCPNAPES